MNQGFYFRVVVFFISFQHFFFFVSCSMDDHGSLKLSEVLFLQQRAEDLLNAGNINVRPNLTRNILHSFPHLFILRAGSTTSANFCAWSLTITADSQANSLSLSPPPNRWREIIPI